MRRHYVRALRMVIDESDIVILVLDARDPEGCRSRLVEEEVRRSESKGKKLVFVLNKIDLVPRVIAQQWLRYLRHYTPTLPFRSVASNQRSNSSCATAPALLQLLKAYKPSAAQSVTVGVVGFPNVLLGPTRDPSFDDTLHDFEYRRRPGTVGKALKSSLNSPNHSNWQGYLALRTRGRSHRKRS
ncbi:hypothetical protein OG21DRAFT_1512440 [Imleria badia]|nr:hypothetical protein OG21DRAFT_1512440 [Imleria badia]